MARMKWGPKSGTQHRRKRPDNVDLGVRPCLDCGKPIRMVIWRGGRKKTPAERYELDGKAKHRCHIRCDRCGQPIIIAEGSRMWRYQKFEPDGITAHLCNRHPTTKRR